MTGKINWKRERLLLTLLAAPFVLFVIAFFYVPLFGWILAFLQYKPGLKIWNCDFIGLSNFKLIFSDRRIGVAVINTLAMSSLGILCSPLPAVFAIVLLELNMARFSKIVQTITTIPNFVSWIIIYALSYAMFSSDGVINHILLHSGIVGKATNILGNENAAWGFQTALGVWKSLGWNAIIYFAAIAGIDSELYDAANVDGAGRIMRILHITVPGISSTFFVLLLLQISNILSSGIDQYLIFYNSMVADKITVLDLYVYRLGLVSQDYSYATAVGIMKTLIAVALLFGANRLSKKIRGESLV